MRPFFDFLMNDARRRLKQGARRSPCAAAALSIVPTGRLVPPECMLEGKAGHKARMSERKARAAQNRLNKRVLIKKAAAVRTEAEALGFRIDEAGRVARQNILQRAPVKAALNLIDKKAQAAVVKQQVRTAETGKNTEGNEKSFRPDTIEPEIPWDEIDASGSTCAFSGDESSLAAPSLSTLSISGSQPCKGVESLQDAPSALPEQGQTAPALCVQEDGENDAALGSSAALLDEIARLEADAARWRAECEEAKAAKHEAEAALAGMKSVLQDRRTSSNDDFRFKKLSSTSKRLARTLADPDMNVSPSAALGIVETLYPERICVLESAQASAEKADRLFRNGRRLLRQLLKLAGEYYETLAEKGDAEARKVFSNDEYAAKESDTTNAGRLGEIRDFVYRGRKIRMNRHLKIGTAADRTRTLRCYFAWIPEEEKIVIGYCGEHLPVAGFS